MTKRHGIGLPGLLLFAVLSAPVFAQPSTSTMEEMTIVAEPSLWALRSGVTRARDAVIDAYNEINEDRRYDIVCFDEVPTGSIIAREVCRPVFVSLIEARMTQDAMNGFDTSALATLDMRREAEKLQENLKRIEAEHPELAALNLEYQQRKNEYEQKHEELCGGKFICWTGSSGN